MRRIVLFFLLWMPLWLSAQVSQWGLLTAEEGLHNPSVTSVLQDHRGFVYLGTELGVSRFDGSNVLNVDFPADAAHNLAVTCMVEEDDGHLLLGNAAGLWRLDRRRLSISRVGDKSGTFGGIDAGVNDMVVVGHEVYIATTRGLCRMQTGERQVETVVIGGRGVPSVSGAQILSLAAGSGHLWLLLEDRLVDLPLSPRAHAASYPSTIGMTAMTLQKGTIYIGTRAKGIYRFDLSRRRFLPMAVAGTDNMGVNGLSTDSHGHLLVATQMDGCLEIDPRTATIVRRYAPEAWGDGTGTVPVRLASPSFFRRLGDGTNWIGYKFFGLDYSFLNRGIFHTYALPGVFDSGGRAVRSFLRDGHRMLVGTRNGLYVVDDERPSVTHIGREHTGADIISCIRRVGGSYLVGTIGGGLHLFDAASLTERTAPWQQSLAAANIYDIADDGHGALWVSSSAGLLRYDKASGRVDHFTDRNSQLPDNEVFCIGFDGKGHGWVSTAGGQCQWDEARRMLTTRAMPSAIVGLGLLRTISRMADGRLLFIPQKGNPALYNTATGSLQRLDLSRWGLGNDFIDLRSIGNGQYIVTCPDAVWLVSPSGPARRFGHIDGLVNSQFQSHAVGVDSKGIFWAATNGGLVWARLQDVRRMRFPHIAITAAEIQTDHWFTPEEVSGVLLDSVLRLSRHDNTFTLRFTPLVYGNTRDLTFRYRLLGHDDGWHTAATTRIITYRHLLPGRYTLRIEAVGMPEISGELTIDVPMTNGAIMLTILVLLLMALIAHVLWCRHYKKPYIWKRLLPQPEKYQKSHLSTDEARRLQQRLLDLMEKERLYLNPDLQVSALAKALGCSTHTLSQLFTQVMHRNYYDFIAEYRVKAFKQLAQDPANRNLTITALAEQCGFKSRNPFLVAFKKYTGMTPKDYMKSLKQ